MNTTQVSGESRAGLVKRWGRKLATLALTTVAFGYLYGWASPWAFPKTPDAGFGRGALHGALMPIALPSLLLGQDVPIYAVENSGRPYKIGYIVGINLCGLAFFGPLFWRPRRAPQPVTETSSDKFR